MNINEFLLKLVDDDCEVKNLAFKESNNEFVDIISCFESKLAIAVSSSFFNENIALFSNMGNINNIQSVFSLPIYDDHSNLILVVLDSNKDSDEFILFDESDSLIHKADVRNIPDELADELINSFKQYDNALRLKLDVIFNQGAVSQAEGEIDEILDLYVDDSSEGINKKAMADMVRDEVLDLNEAELAAFGDEDELDGDDEFLDLIEEEKKPLKKRVMSNTLVDKILNIKEEKFNQQEEITHMPISLYGGLVEISSSNVLKEITYSKKRQNPENMLNKNGMPLIDGEVIFRKLGKIADLQNIDEKNTENTLLISTCKLCDSRFVHYNYDIKDFNNEIFIEISNISEDVSADYLYEYLNSNNGIEDLLYYSKGYNYLRAELIKSVKIPIPSLEIQREIVKASRDAREFFRTVDLLKKEYNSNILDYKHISESINKLKGEIEIDSNTCEVKRLSGSWRHAYQGLVWPLAISYLSATKGGFEVVEKKDNYIKLFEFATAFNAIVLLSGLPEELYAKKFKEIWTDKTLGAYTPMSFGSWIVVSENLAKVYRENNFTSKLDEEFFEKISSNILLETLSDSKDYRNAEFHEAMRNAYEAERTIEILDEYLDDVFDILDIYSNYKLIYTTGRFESHRQGLVHEVILLNGPCAQPIYDRIIFDGPLMSKSLYLYDSKNNRKLLIKDSLMKFKAVDKNKKHWALFIYNNCSKQRDIAYYKCFQSKEEDHKEYINSLKHDVLM